MVASNNNGSGISLGKTRAAKGTPAAAVETAISAVVKEEVTEQLDTRGRNDDRSSRRESSRDEDRGSRFGRNSRDRDSQGHSSTRKARRENSEPVFLTQGLDRKSVV